MARLESFAHYRILGEIGRGGMATVYEARDTVQKRMVALKLLHVGPYLASDQIARFLREAEAAAGIRHPNLARIYDTGAHEGMLYVAMEPCTGSLAEKLAATPLPPREAASTVSRLANAVSTIHDANVVCRDLSPTNVILDSEGTPKILDFGIASVRDRVDVLAPVNLEEMLAYTAPELASEDWRNIGPASDIYSLGAILYFCVSGQPPFRAPTAFEILERVRRVEPAPLRRLIAGVPRELEAICMKCLEKDPPRRYSTARELADDLDRYVSGRPIRAVGPGAWSRGMHAIKRLWAVRAGARREPSESPTAERLSTTPHVDDVSDSIRYVNVCLARHPTLDVVPLDTNLSSDQDYYLRVDIGSLHPLSAVKNPVKFPDELLPRTEDGHWLEVLVSSKDFATPERMHHFFLPREGPSWTCNCVPGGAHKCDLRSRGDHVLIRLRSPMKVGSAQLRLGIYYEKNLVQAQLLTAEVAEVEREGQGYSSWIDYTLTSKFDDLSSIPARTLNILTNENADGTHLVMVNGPGVNPVFHLTEGQMQETVEPAREALRRVHYAEYGGHAGTTKQRENLFDPKTNSKKTADFLGDLTRLAQLGQKLWLLFLEDQPDWWGALREPATIQVARVVGSRFLFPWALVYDIPLEVGASQPYHLCDLLLNWDRDKEELIKSGARQCPYHDQHPVSNVLCPFGFWGLKHWIEQPASVSRNGRICTEIRPTNHPAELVVGLSEKLDLALTKSHLDAIARLPGVTVRPCSSYEGVKQALSKSVELVYFYCHGRQRAVPGSKQPAPYLEIGNTDEIHPEDFSTWRRELHPVNPWESTSPLVFINGCQTVEITPESLLTFVDTFAKADASGVIGTEIGIDQSIASESAGEFFSHLREGRSVGDALQRMRLHLLVKNNVLGLAYTPYCSASLRLAGAA